MASSSLGYSPIVWRPAIATGIPKIMRQHKGQFAWAEYKEYEHFGRQSLGISPAGPNGIVSFNQSAATATNAHHQHNGRKQPQCWLGLCASRCRTTTPTTAATNHFHFGRHNPTGRPERAFAIQPIFAPTTARNRLWLFGCPGQQPLLAIFALRRRPVGTAPSQIRVHSGQPPDCTGTSSAFCASPSAALRSAMRRAKCVHSEW